MRRLLTDRQSATDRSSRPVAERKAEQDQSPNSISRSVNNFKNISLALSLSLTRAPAQKHSLLYNRCQILFKQLRKCLLQTESSVLEEAASYAFHGERKLKTMVAQKPSIFFQDLHNNPFLIHCSLLSEMVPYVHSRRLLLYFKMHCN